MLYTVILRGRYRGLPVAINRSILLPSATLGWAEEEDAYHRERSKSRIRERERQRNRSRSEVDQIV